MSNSLSSSISSSIADVQEKVQYACNSYASFLKDNRVIDDKALNKANKQELIEGFKRLMYATAQTRDAVSKHIAIIHDHSLHDPETIADIVSEKVSDKFEQAKNEMIETFSKFSNSNDIAENFSRKKPSATPCEQVLIIKNISKEDIKASADGSKKTFSSVLQENLSEKLEEIPVTKVMITRQNEAVLKFPTVESCNEAKIELQGDFDVSNSNRKQPVILPRIKIHHIDPTHAQMEKEDLTRRIVWKNPWLQGAPNFAITFIEKKLCYAIAKVSPEVHHKLMDQGRIFLDLSSCTVTEYFHVTQCYRCQEFGHFTNSPYCKAKNYMICLYCCGNHMSSTCPSKKIKEAHKCSNCEKSTIPAIRRAAHNHTSTNKSCPSFLREVEKMKRITCYDQEAFIDSEKIAP